MALYTLSYFVMLFVAHLRSTAPLLQRRVGIRTVDGGGFRRSPFARRPIVAVHTDANAAANLDSADRDVSGVVQGTTSRNFITNIIEEDIKKKKNGGRVVTRFPPEPNGYLHLGHAKSINFNFGVAKAYGGVTNMRFDDTNPAKEDMEYVRSILADVRWLVTGDERPPVTVDGERGVATSTTSSSSNSSNRNISSSDIISSGSDRNKNPWDKEIRHASDYFGAIYDSAEYLIQQGLAYVDNLSQEEMKAYRGTLTEPGKDSPYRTRTVQENLALFRAMRAGKYADGECILRAKIDMSSPNINLRDPALYRIKKEAHPITGNDWCIYPMYDFAHAISDALEGITHSICTLEFADHRPLYDWIIDNLLPSGILPNAEKGWRPTQIEFSRLNIQYTVLSKRKLIQLVKEKHVNGWDDPRMPTICGMRRRGYPPEALKLFCDRIGISKAENNIDISVLEDCVRESLDSEAPRAFAIVKPLKVTITNWPTTPATTSTQTDSSAGTTAAERKEVGKEEVFYAERHPKKEELGTRALPFTGSVYIDRDDFFDTGIDGTMKPPKGYKRLVPGGQVRLKYAYVINCEEVIRDATTGEVTELLCTYDPATRSGVTPEGTKRVKGIIQWVSTSHAVKARLALYDRLFTSPTPGRDQPEGNFLLDLNPESLRYCEDAVVEPSVHTDCVAPSTTTAVAVAGSSITYQFERVGYFTLDRGDLFDSKSAAEGGVLNFNRVVTLKDTWANQFATSSTSLENTSATAAVTSSSSANGNGVPKQQQQQQQQAALVEEDIRRVELRVGQVLSVERHPDADTLYVEKVDCGDKNGEPRIIISGLVKYVPMEELIGRRVVVVANLKPSKMRGILSEGMLLAASKPMEVASSSPLQGDEKAGAEEIVELLSPPEGAPVGELIFVEGFDVPQPDLQLKSKSAQEVWKRVVCGLRTNERCEAVYFAEEHGETGEDKGEKRGGRLMTSAGPCTVKSLAQADVR